MSQAAEVKMKDCDSMRLWGYHCCLLGHLLLISGGTIYQCKTSLHIPPIGRAKLHQDGTLVEQAVPPEADANNG